MDLMSVADELYALTLDEFTGTRNERAKDAKGADKALSEAIRKLPKPSTAAWVVNMLVRHQAEQLANVLELGASLRQAQENLDGAELRQLNKQRRQLTAAVTNQARSVAHELGVRVSEAVAAQVEETLRAAMTDEGAARAVRTGQLVEALSATGVGELDVSDAVAVPEAIGMTARPVQRKRPGLSVVDSPGAPGSANAVAGAGEAGERGSGEAGERRVRDAGEAGESSAREAGEPGTGEAVAPSGEVRDVEGSDSGRPDSEDALAAERAREAAREAARERARQSAEEAEEAATRAQKKLDKAIRRVSRLEARSLQLQGYLEELRRKVGEVEFEIETLDDELTSAEDKRDRAVEKQGSARAAADEARAAVDDLGR